jgi:hypothetical protein
MKFEDDNVAVSSELQQYAISAGVINEKINGEDPNYVK